MQPTLDSVARLQRPRSACGPSHGEDASQHPGEIATVVVQVVCCTYQALGQAAEMDDVAAQFLVPEMRSHVLVFSECLGKSPQVCNRARDVQGRVSVRHSLMIPSPFRPATTQTSPRNYHHLELASRRRGTPVTRRRPARPRSSRRAARSPTARRGRRSRRRPPCGDATPKRDNSPTSSGLPACSTWSARGSIRRTRAAASRIDAWAVTSGSRRTRSTSGWRLVGVIAYNLGNLLRRLALPLTIQSWPLTSLQQRLFKTGGRLIGHARYFTLQLAESYLTRPLFRQIVARIDRLAWHRT